jgi:preprotein translocase subunit SecF
MKIDSVKNSKVYLGFSGLLLALSVFFMVQSTINFGTPFKLGLDFTGGSKIEYKFKGKTLKEALSSEQVQNTLNSIGFKNSLATISSDQDPILIIRTQAVSDADSLDTLNARLQESYGDFELNSIDTVSPIIGPELLQSGLIALAFTVVGIILYVSFRFKRDYALCAIAALVHDVLITSGLFAYLGIYHGIEIDTLFITALLTIFGFSIHDTIVVFDRIRENQKMQTQKFTFEEMANHSVNQVSVRSMNTSFTVLVTLACLYLLGGASTKVFTGALFIGMFVGTYSSLFIASPLLVIARTAKK